MNFENYKILYWLWALPILGGLFAWTERKRARILFSFFAEQLKQQLPLYTVWGRRLQFLFFTLACLCFLVALMRPFDGVETIEVERKGVDLYFLVDVSPSMLAQDVAPSRIERARYKILDFLQILKGDRVGLVAFSGEAFVLTPLTGDYETFSTFVNELNPDLFPVPGTNIRAAVEKAVQSFAKLTQSSSKAIVLFSDGEDSIGLSPQDVETIQKLGVQIYVVGIGTEEGAPVPNEDGGYKTDKQGQMVLAKLDEAALQDLSLATGGGYVRATPNDQDLRQIYDQGIRKSFQDQQFAQEQKQLPNYQFQMFIALGLLAFILDLLISHKKLFLFRKNKKSLLVIVFCLFAANAQAKNPFEFDKANEHFDAGEYSQSLEALKALEAANPDDPEVSYNLGNAYYKLQQFKKSKEAYLKALNAPDLQTRRNSLYNLGNSAFRNNELQEAIDYYEQSLAIDPNFEMAKTNLEFVKAKLEQQKQDEQKQDEQKQDEQSQDEQNQDEQNQDEQKQDEQNQDEQKQDEQKQDEQKQDEQKQDEQKQDEKKQGEQKQDEQKQDEQKQDEQKQDEQKQDEQKQDEQKQDEQKQDEQKQDEQKQDTASSVEEMPEDSKTDPQKIESWLKALDDNPAKALEYMIQKNSSSSTKKFDKDW